MYAFELTLISLCSAFNIFAAQELREDAEVAKQKHMMGWCITNHFTGALKKVEDNLALIRSALCPTHNNKLWMPVSGFMLLKIYFSVLFSCSDQIVSRCILASVARLAQFGLSIIHEFLILMAVQIPLLQYGFLNNTFSISYPF